MSRPRVLLLCLSILTPLPACTTISVYEPVTAEISLVADVSVLHKASDAFCKDTREKGLATGEASLTSLADMLTGKDAGAGVYWRLIGADKNAPASVVARVRGDMTGAVKALDDLNALARTLLKAEAPTRGDVSEFERALIHARQARDSLSDAFTQVNKRSEREYQITLELAPIDEALGRARLTADDLASARVDDPQAPVAS